MANIRTTPAVSATPMLLGEALPQASGKTSAPIIQIIAPAASPNPNGRNGESTLARRKAGTAINGWGRLEKTLQNPAFHILTPRGTRTSPIASPSGMLCNAMTRLIRDPKDKPFPRERPTAMPSGKEWMVITPTMMTASNTPASASSPTSTDPRFSSHFRLTVTKTNPVTTPMIVVAGSTDVPSFRSSNAAASNSPLASAVAKLIKRAGIAFEKIKGMTPSPVATAVNVEYRITVAILGMKFHRSPIGRKPGADAAVSHPVHLWQKASEIIAALATER